MDDSLRERSSEEDRFEAEFAERFERAIADEPSELRPRPNLSRAVMACAVVTPDAEPLWVDRRFAKWIGADAIDADLCAKVAEGSGERVVQTRDRDGNLLLLLFAPAAVAQFWPLAPDAAALLKARSDALVIGAFSLSHFSDDLLRIGRASGMTNLEARVAAALVTHGHMRRAAAHAGVTYHTARKAAAAGMARLNAPNQAALVRKLSALVTSITPPREMAERLLCDIFGLRARDATLALLIAEGHSRKKAAEIAGVSSAVAKDGFARIFESLDIEKASEIPRIVADAFLGALLVDANRPVLASLPGYREPLRLFARPDGTHVAVSDYGPTGADPVLILHSSLSTRYPFRRLVRTLQQAGFRPITIDRPGFGLTDDIDHEGDPFAAGVADLRLACEGLGIERVHMVTRGGTFAALAMARDCPDLVGRVVVSNPDLLHHHCAKRSGPLGVARTAFERFPDRIERVAGWIAGQLTPERTARIIRMGIGTVEVDVRAFEDPDDATDYQRSIMVFGTGRLSGFVREQRGYATLADVDGLDRADRWTLLVGEADPIHEIDAMLDFWRRKLPGATIRRIPTAGRFIELTHTDLIVAALRK